MNYKNNIFILRNLHKLNDEELIDYNFKKHYQKFLTIILKIDAKNCTI